MSLSTTVYAYDDCYGKPVLFRGALLSSRRRRRRRRARSLNCSQTCCVCSSNYILLTCTYYIMHLHRIYLLDSIAPILNAFFEHLTNIRNELRQPCATPTLRVISHNSSHFFQPPRAWHHCCGRCRFALFHCVSHKICDVCFVPVSAPLLRILASCPIQLPANMQVTPVFIDLSLEEQVKSAGAPNRATNCRKTTVSNCVVMFTYLCVCVCSIDDGGVFVFVYTCCMCGRRRRQRGADKMPRPHIHIC